jgi:mannose-6-phosphate isomerase
MKEASDADFIIDETTPYAELWLGTHPSGMSTVLVSNSETTNLSQNMSLLDYVRMDPVLHMGQQDDDDLLFLLKILSVRKVLSIQAHPDKQLAERLHANHPDLYKDPNHKPEMAIALSESVRAMFGFRPLDEIAQHLNDYPEFYRLIGHEITAHIKEAATTTRDKNNPLACKSALRQMFQAYLEADNFSIQTAVDEMVARLRTLEGMDDVQKLIFQLHEQFPGDCGIFAPLIFNIVEMSKGEALFIDANEPHAYISGEIIECMACSDNVVRAGLTPKHKDVHTLVNMLTYKTQRPLTTFGERIDDCTTRYQPPVADFCVEQIVVAPGASYMIGNVNSPSVLLAIEGDGRLEQDDVCSLVIGFGESCFCSAGTTVTVVSGDYGITLTRAFNNVYL